MELEKFHKIVLASASPRRLELLRQIGIEPEVKVSHVEEKVTSSIPGDVVMELAAQKAMDVASGEPEGTLVIGSDTVVAVDGKILGKPHDHDEAVKMIKSIEGRAHQVFTGVCMVHCGMSEAEHHVVTFFDKTDFEVYPMTEDEIYTYAMSEEPMDKAGAYAVQGFFGRYIKGLNGSYANVMGLPISKLYQELKKLYD